MFHFLWHNTSIILSQRRKGRQVYQAGEGLDCRSPIEQLAMKMTDGQLWPIVIPPFPLFLLGIVYFIYKEGQEGMI